MLLKKKVRNKIAEDSLTFTQNISLNDCMQINQLKCLKFGFLEKFFLLIQ